MSLKTLLTRRTAAIAGGILIVVLVGVLLAFKPVTRTVVAQDAVCTYCHLEWEFSPDVRLSATRPHPATPEGGQAACVDCHLPDGFLDTANVYLHYASMTDLFGHLRGIDGERQGAWIPFRAKTAYRVRDRMVATDSGTCRTCHIESEIEPRRVRGKNAHKLALEEDKTCMECHTSLVHRTVDPRPEPAAAKE